jgi:hypothetical protein
MSDKPRRPLEVVKPPEDPLKTASLERQSFVLPTPPAVAIEADPVLNIPQATPDIWPVRPIQQEAMAPVVGQPELLQHQPDTTPPAAVTPDSSISTLDAAPERASVQPSLPAVAEATPEPLKAILQPPALDIAHDQGVENTPSPTQPQALESIFKQPIDPQSASPELNLPARPALPPQAEVPHATSESQISTTTELPQSEQPVLTPESAVQDQNLPAAAAETQLPTTTVLPPLQAEVDNNPSQPALASVGPTPISFLHKLNPFAKRGDAENWDKHKKGRAQQQKELKEAA